jgi:hypothetical protein
MANPVMCIGSNPVVRSILFSAFYCGVRLLHWHRDVPLFSTAGCAEYVCYWHKADIPAYAGLCPLLGVKRTKFIGVI